MTADVALVLEGTYPFVPGGVSSWVHQMVSHMPERSFELIHISPRRGFYEAPTYDVPKNVVGMTECFLSRPRPERPVRPSRALLRTYCDYLAAGFDGWRLLADMAPALQRDPDVIPALLHSREVWEVIRTSYLREAADESFVGWFWNWICVQEPLLQVLATPLPEARLIHTISTGYAGLIAAIESHGRGRPAVLTEHGIYTKERRIEIFAAEWIQESRRDEVLPLERASVFRQVWNEQFEALSRICYAAAEIITTLYEGNQRDQIRGGADPTKCRIIPNGIAFGAFELAANRRRQLQSQLPRHRPRDGNREREVAVAFVGRVTPIKDVRTFLSAMRLVAQQVPHLRVRILGPLDEDREYADECSGYARQLGLGDVVSFEGRVDLRETLPELDVVVLTSISEAQPLVVLEAGAVGIPVVCTDVGCCRDLVEGARHDQNGSGGIITPIASPGATAAAVLELVRDPERRRRLGENLRRRVEQHYHQDTMIRAYEDLYDEALAAASAEPGRPDREAVH